MRSGLEEVPGKGLRILDAPGLQCFERESQGLLRDVFRRGPVRRRRAAKILKGSRNSFSLSAGTSADLGVLASRESFIGHRSYSNGGGRVQKQDGSQGSFPDRNTGVHSFRLVRRRSRRDRRYDDGRAAGGPYAHKCGKADSRSRRRVCGQPGADCAGRRRSRRRGRNDLRWFGTPDRIRTGRQNGHPEHRRARRRCDDTRGWLVTARPRHRRRRRPDRRKPGRCLLESRGRLHLRGDHRMRNHQSESGRYRARRAHRSGPGGSNAQLELRSGSSGP